MARFRGPRLKLVRRFQAHLPGLTRKSAERRPYPPGQHGPNRRRKMSDYAVRLEEKQKLRFNYQVSEKQLRKYFKKAKASKGDTGLRLLQILETRLDNVVFRAGFAPTIPAARQMVAHGHVTINGKRVDIPSYQLREGEEVSLGAKGKANELFKSFFAQPSLVYPSYLEMNEKEMSATVKALPERDDIPLEVQENLIIEHYNRVA